MKLSYSALDAYTKCPRYFKRRYIDKAIPFVPNPASERGRRIHEDLEAAVLQGTDPGVWTPEGLLDAVRGADGEAEAKLGMTAAGAPCGFFDRGVKFRGAIDVLMGRPGRYILLDWKTGKVRPDDLQADSYAALLRAGDPGAAVLFVWVYVDQRTTRKREVPQDAGDRIRRMIAVVEEDTRHIPRTSWYCRFCPVLDCEYNQNEER